MNVETHCDAASIALNVERPQQPRIPRIDFVELHELSRFPQWLRDAVTDALEFGFKSLNIYAAVLPLLKRVLNVTGSNRILDLASGGGGPWLSLQPALQESAVHAEVMLSDKYPNRCAFERAASASNGKITFHAQPIDATQVPAQLSGVRTMFSSFHHFSPDQARLILQDAVNAREGIAIFEASSRTAYSILMVFFWTAVQLLLAPFISPFRFSRLIWTYIIPVIPFVLFFDGVASCFRTYCPAELMEIANAAVGHAYRWEAGECRVGFLRLPIIYLLGHSAS